MTRVAEIRHGASAYSNVNIRCRCVVCREANRVRGQIERDKRAARLRADPTLAPHGSVYTYRNWRCRCRPCTAANSAASAAYKRSRVGAR